MTTDPTVYATTCGLSMLDALAIDRGRGRGGPAGPLRVLTERWADQLYHGESDLRAWWSQATDDLNDASLPWWTTEVSAETATLAHRLGHASPQIAPGPVKELAATLRRVGHTVVLLASDTPRGLASAVLVGAQLVGGDPARVRFETVDATRGNAGDHKFESGSVTVVRVAGLAPNARDGLAAGAAGTGLVLRAAYGTALAQRLEIHLSGGFKGALLQTMAMTEILHSLDETPPVSAWYLFDDQTTPAAAEIPLRRFTRGYLTTIEKELTLVATGRPPRPAEAVLEGVAWTRRPDINGHHLNGFGQGYLAVLGGSGFADSDEGPWS